MPPCLLTLELIFYSKLNSEKSYEEKDISSTSSAEKLCQSKPKEHHLITPLIIGKLDHGNSNLSLTKYIYFTFHLLWNPSFSSQTIISCPKHDQNKWLAWRLHETSRLCMGGLICLMILFSCLWGFGFKNLKPPDSEKINLSQFASENLNPIKSTSAVSGDSYSSVSQEWAFWVLFSS